TGLATLADATAGDLSFLGSDRYLQDFAASDAGAFLVQKRVKLPPENHKRVLVVDDADLAMAKVAELFAPPIPRPALGVDPSAIVAPTARLAERIAMGPYVHVGTRTAIGAGSILHA